MTIASGRHDVPTAIATGVMAAVLVSVVPKTRGHSRWFVTFFAAVNLFWFAGCMVYSGALNVGGLAFVARPLGWIPPWRSLSSSGRPLYVRGRRLMTDVLRVEGGTCTLPLSSGCHAGRCRRAFRCMRRVALA